MADEHLKALTMYALSNETPSENYLPEPSLKRKWDEINTVESTQITYDPTGYWQIGNSIVHKIFIGGKENYSVDGFIVPRLPIGETGRIELKASLTGILKRNSELRRQTNALSTLKCASICQLLVMAKVCGLWEKAERISSWYSSRRKSV